MQHYTKNRSVQVFGDINTL